jgi:acetyl esterase/lipase
MKNVLYTLLAVCYSTLLSGQFSTVAGFNYYDINRSAFTVDTDCSEIPPGEQEEAAYLLTSLQLAEAVDDVFVSQLDTVDQIVGSYLISKRPYLAKTLGGEKFRWILIRPNDNEERPVILVTHGGKSASATSRRVLSLGVYDLVQRGYAVVYYQSAPGPGSDVPQALTDVGFKDFCISDEVWTPDVNIDCFQQAVYLRYLSALAAFQYAVGTRAEHKLDTDNLFAMGFSGGAIATIYGALVDEGDFSNSLFADMDKIEDISLFPTADVEVKAVASLAGGILHPSTEGFKIGENLLDQSDTNTRFLLFHGQDDYAVRPGVAPLLWSLPQSQLPGSQMSGSIDLADQMDAANIPNKLVITCSGSHDVYAFPCANSDDNFGNNPDFSLLGPCIRWAIDGNFTGFNYDDVCTASSIRPEWGRMVYVLQQIHDYGKISAHFFHKDFTDNGPAVQPDAFVTNLLNDPSPSAVNPAEYPYAPGIGNTNGHWDISEKCLQQDCSGLYFNKEGTGSATQYAGDIVAIPTEGLPNFNSDFTLEFRLTPDRLETPVKTFFSYLKNGGGIELFIDRDQHLGFKKSVGTVGSIIGQDVIEAGKCYHVALRRVGNTFSIYLNGVLQGQEKTFVISLAKPSDLLIGNTANLDRNGGYDGVVNYFRIWDSALQPTAFDEQDLMPDASGLVANWAFDRYYEQSLSSTNGNFTASLGSSLENEDYDPRWVRNDEACECPVNLITSTAPSVLQGPEITVFPNPSPRRLLVRQQGSGLKEINLTLYNASSQVVQRAKMRTRQHKLFLRKPGVYFLHARSAGATTIKKVVVQ